MSEAVSEVASWRALLSRKHLGECIVVAGGVGLLAINEMMTASILPTVIADVGGERLYAWAITLFLGGSVISASVAYSVLQHNGVRRSYLIGLSLIALGSMMCALAPNMHLLVAGRAVQGSAGGLLAGLGYAVIRTELPKQLWTRMSALLSVTVGLQVFIAPAIGMAFVHFDAWRWAYAVTILAAAALAIPVWTALDAECVDSCCRKSDAKVPVRSVVLVAATMLAISAAQLPDNAASVLGLLFAAAVLVVGLLWVERKSPDTVLPSSTFRPGPLKWIYLTIALLMGALMVDAYVPLFGQRLADLTPIKAGLLSAALTLGWMVSQVLSAPLENRRSVVRVVCAGPLAMAVGLMLTIATQRENPSAGVVVVWWFALLLVGVGCGAAYPHLVARAMDSVDGPTEGSQAGVAINIVAQFSAALAVGVAGVVDITAGDPQVAGDLQSVRWLLLVFVIPALGAAITAQRAIRQHT